MGRVRWPAEARAHTLEGAQRTAATLAPEKGDMTMPPVVQRLRRHIPFLALAIILGATISGASPALSALPSGSSVTTASTWGNTLSLQRPSTTTAGDVLVASVNARLTGSAAITAPSGWTLIRRDSSVPGTRPLSQAL